MVGRSGFATGILTLALIVIMITSSVLPIARADSLGLPALEELWAAPIGEQIYEYGLIGDFDGDSRNDVVAVLQNQTDSGNAT